MFIATSLASLGNKVLEAPGFEMPEFVGRVVKAEVPKKEEKLRARNLISKALSIFSLKSQAEAGTVSR